MTKKDIIKKKKSEIIYEAKLTDDKISKNNLLVYGAIVFIVVFIVLIVF